MIFDKLLFAAERGILPRPVAKIVEAASYFFFPHAYHEVFSPSSAERKELDQAISERCFLPLNPMAIEDKSSVVLLADLEEGATGMSPRRFFLDCYSLGADAQKQFEFQQVLVNGQMKAVKRSELSSAELESLRQAAFADSYFMVAWGFIRDVRLQDPLVGRDMFILDGAGSGAVILDRENRAQPVQAQSDGIDGEAVWQAVESSARNALTALRECAWFNAPNRWVVESSPTKPKKNRKGMIPRTGNRSKFQLLTVEEIRELFWKSPEFQRQWERGVTLRRRHPRTFHSERYERSGLRNSTIWIDATWQGPESVQLGAWTYKVRLDL